MHSARALRGVSVVTVTSVQESAGVVPRLEQLRAVAERTVARQPLIEHDRSKLSSDIKIVESAGNIESIGRQLSADRIVNLSGANLGQLSGTSTHSIFELRWDAELPTGLGERRAASMPPRTISIVVRDGESNARIVQQSQLTSTPGTPAADRRNATSRSVALLLRALSMSDAELQNGEVVRSEGLPTSGAGERSANAVLSSVSAVAAAVTRRAMRPMYRDDAWELWYRTTPSQFVAHTTAINANEFKPYRGGFDRFFADSIAITHNGIDAVFFEEYPYALRRGVISCAVLRKDGTLGPPQRVLERPYHLSYPFVFHDGDRVYMVPESSGNKTVDLYECTQFPDQWTFRQTLIENISATDATLHFDGNLWWMFATVSEQGAYSWDELHIYSADTLTSRWVPHPGNPVKCDATSARPAGPLFVRNGRLIRPTQDCSVSYGGAINLCEIEVLTPTEFREKVVDRLDPTLISGMNGLHTLSASEGIEVIDARPERRWRWEPGTVGTSAANTE